MDDHDEIYFDGDDLCAEPLCPECEGEGWGIIGEYMSPRDIDLGRHGEVERCRNCGGSGLRKDCTVF